MEEQPRRQDLAFFHSDAFQFKPKMQEARQLTIYTFINSPQSRRQEQAGLPSLTTSRGRIPKEYFFLDLIERTGRLVLRIIHVHNCIALIFQFLRPGLVLFVEFRFPYDIVGNRRFISSQQSIPFLMGSEGYLISAEGLYRRIAPQCASKAIQVGPDNIIHAAADHGHLVIGAGQDAISGDSAVLGAQQITGEVLVAAAEPSEGEIPCEYFEALAVKAPVAPLIARPTMTPPSPPAPGLPLPVSPIMQVKEPRTITPPCAVWSPSRAAGRKLIMTPLEPLTITSGGPTHMAIVVTLAAGRKSIKTVGTPGGMIGPPT